MQDVNDLVIFAKIVELRSFSAAARLLGLPKSNVSHRVARLEERLGVRLLQRSTRSVSVTPIGDTYYRYCQKIARDVEEAAAAIRDIQSVPRGLLRVSFPVAFGSIFMSPLIIEFMNLYPEVRVKIVSTDRRVAIIDENFDVVVRIGWLPPSALIARHLGVLHQHLYATPQYLDRRGVPATLDELRRHDCFAFGDGDGAAHWTLVGAGGRQDVAFEPRSTSNDPLMLRSLVMGGLGIAMIPDILCHAYEQQRRLVRVLPEWSAPPIDLHLLYPTHKGLPLVVRTFLDFIIKNLSVSPPWDTASSPTPLQ